MKEDELRRLETKYRKKTGEDPDVTIPANGAPEDLPEFLKRAGLAKLLLAEARQRQDAKAMAALEAHVTELKRAVRARAIQRRLNMVEGKPQGFVSPWPNPP